MSRNLVVGVVLALVGSCAVCGLGAVLLAGASDGSPASEDQAAAASGGLPESGEHPAALLALWSGGPEKLALYGDGRAKKYLRQSWQGGNAPVVCTVKADFEGTWSARGDQLTLTFTEGRWQTCEGERAFEPFTEQLEWRVQSTPNSYSPFGLTLWLKGARGEDGLNKVCLDPDDCPKFSPDPF